MRWSCYGQYCDHSGRVLVLTRRLRLPLNILGDRRGYANSRTDTAWLIFLINGLGTCWSEIPITLGTLLAAAAWRVTRCRNARVSMIWRGLICDFGSELPSRSASTKRRGRAGRVGTIANDTKGVAGLGELADLCLKRRRCIQRRRERIAIVVEMSVLFARADFGRR